MLYKPVKINPLICHLLIHQCFYICNKCIFKENSLIKATSSKADCVVTEGNSPLNVHTFITCLFQKGELETKMYPNYNPP